MEEEMEDSVSEDVGQTVGMTLLKSALPDEEEGVLREFCGELNSVAEALEMAIGYIRVIRQTQPKYTIQHYVQGVQRIKALLRKEQVELDHGTIISIPVTVSRAKLPELEGGSQALDLLQWISHLSPDHPIRLTFLEQIQNSQLQVEEHENATKITGQLRIYKVPDFKKKASKKLKQLTFADVLRVLSNFVHPEDEANGGEDDGSPQPASKDEPYPTYYRQTKKLKKALKFKLYGLNAQFKKVDLKRILLLLDQLGLVKFQEDGDSFEISPWTWTNLLNRKWGEGKPTTEGPCPGLLKALGGLQRIILNISREDIPHAIHLWQKALKFDEVAVGFMDGFYKLVARLAVEGVGTKGMREDRCKLICGMGDVLGPKLGQGHRIFIYYQNLATTGEAELLKGERALYHNRGLEHKNRVTRFEEGSRVSNSKLQIGFRLLRQEKWDQAIDVFEKVLKEHPADLETSMITLPYLASALRCKKEFKTAIEMECKVLSFRKNKYGPRSIFTMQTKSNIAHMLNALYRKKSCNANGSIFDPVADLMRADLGSQNYTLLSFMEGKASARLEVDQPLEAVIYLREVKLMLERYLGSDDPFVVLVVMEQIGGALIGGKDRVGGCTVWERMYLWMIKWSGYGSTVDDKCDVLAKSARSLINDKRYNEAMEKLEILVQLYKTSSKKPDLSLAENCFYIARVQFIRGYEEFAMDYCNRQTLPLILSIVGSDHTLYKEATDWNSQTRKTDLGFDLDEKILQAKTLVSQDRLEDALGEYRLILRKQRLVLGKGDLRTLTSHSHIGLIMLNQGYFYGALEVFEDVEVQSIQTYGDEGMSTLDCRKNVVNVLEKIGQKEMAKRMTEEVLKVEEKLLGIDNPRTVATRLVLDSY